MPLTGLHVPLITPFTADDRVDTVALDRLAHSVLDAGATGLVALGTTGEPVTLDVDERRRVVDVCAAACVAFGATLTVGVGSNSTAGTAQALRDLDPRASAALVVVPYFTRPSEAGVVEHFRRVAAASPVPVVVYDVAPRTARPLGPDALRAIGRIDGVSGFKYAPGALSEATMRLVVDPPAGCVVLGGDDVLAPALLAMGSPGVIAASGNVAPALFAELVDAWRRGAVAQARTLTPPLVQLAAALFAEPSPAVFKGVLAALGVIASPAVRLPLLPASRQAVDVALGALAAADGAGMAAEPA